MSATDIEGSAFANAGQFSINGVTPNGDAVGAVNFVFRGAFAAFWGACPLVCPGQTFVLHLKGEVTAVETSGGSVVLSGPMSETDIGQGGGVIFHEAEVPEFQLEVVRGHLSIDDGLKTAAPATLASAGPRQCAAPTR